MADEIIIDKLSLEIESKSADASKGLEALALSLGKIKLATKGGLGLKAVANQVSAIGKASKTVDSASVHNLNGLASAIQRLTKCGSLSASFATQLKKIGESTNGLSNVDYSQLDRLTEGLSSITSLPKSNLSSYTTQLANIPKIIKGLPDKKIEAFAEKIRKLADALRPLGTEMQKVANGFSAFPAKIQKLISATNSSTVANKNNARSWLDILSKHTVLWGTMKSVYNSFAKFIKTSNDYIENINLFTVSMGEYAKEAKAYATEVSEVMGIDPGEWMRNQGVFMTLATGFGVAGDRANTMSKNLTQLGYDISSFFNIDVGEAMEKLQSGIAGELEPLRRIGYDLSQARLEQEAYTLGITKKLSAMTQAEKAELRYHAILTQVTTAQGDMARTLDAPANQIRILKAQITQLTRAIGNLFIPALKTALPFLTATLKVTRLLVDTIAKLFGIEIATIDWSGAEDSVGNVGEGLENATDSAKKLKDYMMGFDELNVIDTSSNSDENDFGTGFDFDLPEYDFIGEATKGKINELVDKMKEWLGLTEEITSWSDLLNTRLGTILTTVGAVGIGLAAWKISSAVITNLPNIKQALLDISNSKAITKGLGIGITITGIVFEAVGAYELGQGNVSLANILKTAIGAALGIGGSLLVFGTGPVGWTVGIGLAITTFITGFTIGKWEEAKDDDLAKRFGDMVLSDADIQDIVSQLTTSELSLELKLFVSQKTALEEVKKDVDEVLETLRLYNFKISMGVNVSQEDYQTTVDELVSSIAKYLEEKQVTATMSISILLDGSATGDRLTTFTNNFYNDSKLELAELGGKLKDTIAEGFVEGEWIPDKLQQAIELQKEIQSVYDYLSEVEFKAKMKSLKLDASATDLSVTDFEKIMSEAQEVIETNITNLEGVRLEGLKVASMEFDQNVLNGMSEAEAMEIYNTTVAKIEEEFQNGKMELTVGTYDFGIDVIKERYSSEIETTVPFFEQTTRELFTQGSAFALPEETYTNIDNLYSQLHDAYLAGLEDLDISNEARANIKKLLGNLEPAEEDYLKLVDDALKTGKAVPENVSQGLNDINMLAAISGDMKALNYLIGQHLSTDEEFLNLLTTAEDAGKKLGEQVGNGLNANLQVIENSAEGTITLINDTIGEKVVEVTPTLVKNLEDLGYDLSDGLLKGADEKINADKQSWWDWAWLPWNWFKSANEINSPSKLFARGGGYIAEGLFNGVDGGVLESDYDTIFSRISDALDSAKLTIKNIINSILTFIETMANGVVKGINTVIKALNRLKIKAPEWVTKLTGIGSFSFNIDTLDEISIPRLAEGGFPETGQLFIAREAGAEMVGSIGRKTAVANNDQIVTAVANGVAEANDSQNALLREQNALLRAILEKKSGVYLDGREITRSVEKHQRERGRVLVTGGAT